MFPRIVVDSHPDFFVKEPFISAITCSYKLPHGTLNHTNLDDTLSSNLSEWLNNNDQQVSNKLTKKHSQLNYPLELSEGPLHVDNQQLFFRVRWNPYTKNGRKRSNFANQMCFFYKTHDSKTKCFKLFRNGIVHVTGFTDTIVMKTKTKAFIQALLLYTNGSQDDFEFQYSIIHLINASFKIKFELNLSVLHNKINDSVDGWNALYEPELYCGLMLTTPSFKANIFRSGSIIITGVKCMNDLYTAFQTLINELLSYLQLT